jgi:hypothetical protein
MYTTDIHGSGTVSATDEERLPPGGFSLRHGFPSWFGRGSRRSADRERGGKGSLQTPLKGSGIESPGSVISGTANSVSPTPRQTSGGVAAGGKGDITTFDVLRYIRSTFDEEEVLDAVPLEAAGNPGAWHAWRTHRIKSGKLSPTSETKEKNAWHDGLSEDEEIPSAPEGYRRLAGGTSSPMQSRRPGEWNWEGVWEVRVKKGVEGSLAEAVLFGKDAGDDLISFLKMDVEQVEAIQENIRRSLESVEPQRRGIV